MWGLFTRCCLHLHHTEGARGRLSQPIRQGLMVRLVFGLDMPQARSTRREDIMTQIDTQAHTPGRRTVRGTSVGVIDDRDGVLILTARAFTGTGSSLAEQEANARRLAACENACEGIPTEALEADIVAEMLEACERAATGLVKLTGVKGLDGDAIDAIRLRLRAVIAKAKGESP